MCGRYALIPTKEMADEYFKAMGFELKPNYNVAPMHTMPIKTAEGLHGAIWGLVPSWSKEFKPSFSSINARSETAAQKPLYRTPFKKRRCLVPASGFYEWQKVGSEKHPFYFRVSDEPIFSFAGLYDIWYDANDEPHKSYTILTTTPNRTVKIAHDRMPVILNEDEADYWLQPDAELEEIQAMLNPFDEAMTAYEVDRAVGNVKNNNVDLIRPLKAS